MRKVFPVFLLLFVGIASALYFLRGSISITLLEFSKTSLPDVTLTAQIPDILDEVNDEVNLPVPFQTQAPKVNWDYPYQEACEEASVILLDAYYKGRTLTVHEMDTAILKLVEWEKKRFGFYEHTTAADTATILREYFGYQKVEVLYDVSLEDLKRELSTGRPVIVPLKGREVGNPFYHQPGPLYHMLVVRGFTDDGRLITNDVGTRHGENYPYDSDIFLKAMADIVKSGSLTDEIQFSRRAIIVVSL